MAKGNKLRGRLTALEGSGGGMGLGCRLTLKEEFGIFDYRRELSMG